MITSASNRKVKDIVGLIKKASLRRERGLFVVEGIRMYMEIPDDRLVESYVSEAFYKQASADVKAKIESHAYELVSDEIIKSITDTKTPQGIIAIVKMTDYMLRDVIASGATPHLLILETLQDPGNLGTMIRAGEGAGLTGIIMDETSVDVYNPKVVRSTMGSIFRVPCVYVPNLHEAIEEIKKKKIKVYAAHLKESVLYDKADYSGPTAFMIGNEAAGLSDETADMADSYIRIPMLGKVESLNAAMAATILMYELARQRRA